MSKKVNTMDLQLLSTSEVSFHHMANQGSKFHPGLEQGQGVQSKTELRESQSLSTASSCTRECLD